MWKMNGGKRNLYIPYIRPLSSNALSILLHLIVNELMSFEHFLLAGRHRRSERLGAQYWLHVGRYWVACLEGKRYGQNAC